MPTVWSVWVMTVWAASSLMPPVRVVVMTVQLKRLV